MAQVAFDVPPQPETGPSSPLLPPPIAVQQPIAVEPIVEQPVAEPPIESLADVEMEDTSASAVEPIAAPQPESVVPVEPLQPIPTDAERPEPLPIEAEGPTATFPYTPPEETRDDPNAAPSTVEPIAHPIEPSEASTPAAASTTPEPVKHKPKRKRNAAAGPSRRTSSDLPRDVPPHYLGKDNQLIRCICGIEEDTGTSVQCERCYAWEHSQCWGFSDDQILPDVWLCELCEPRPHDSASATRLQLTLVAELAEKRAVLQAQGEDEKKGRKPKRPRMGSVMEETDRDPSPGVMGPPAKPKRRAPAPKPRSQKQDTAPTPSEPPDVEDDYFRIEPWTLEYTPIKENVVRGAEARRTMCAVYREWVDAEDEVERRPISGPSGLPSPTETGARLSPDYPPDFSVLAPPVPPVFLVGPNLDALSSPTSVRAISDTPSFLPLTYVELGPTGIYTRPALYGVYADEPIPPGAFVGEYRGEIIDCASYRRDPINQYAGLGMPKPHVRSIGPPVNLLIDSRGYGNTLRYVRSGCHPNVVLRPLFWRRTNEPPRLKFGVFASRDIAKEEELILAWEWDDQHVVHALRSSLAPSLVDKFDATLTHLLGTFSACACRTSAGCALAQMRRLVENKDGMRGRVELGELVGAVRGWRRREAEVERVRKWPQYESARSVFSERSERSDRRSERSERLSEGRSERSDRRSERSERLSDGRSESEVEQNEPMEVDEQYAVSDLSVSASPPKRPLHAQPTILASPPPPSASSIPLPQSPNRVVSSSLSTAPSIRPEPDLEEDDGTVSDATTATMPRSHFSDSEEEHQAVVGDRPKALARRRRVLSPVVEADMSIEVKKLAKVKADKGDKDKVRLKATSAPSSMPKPAMRRSKNRIVSSPVSEDERMDVDPRSSEITREESRVIAQEQIAPITNPTEVIESVPVERPPTPPREPTPPPRLPTPPPVPARKIALSEYLKNHKIRKESASAPTPASESAPEVVDEIPTAVKAEPEPAARLNLFDHLPSRTPGTPALTTPSNSLATPAPSYVPRSEYFPPPSTSASKLSSSYTPRTPSISSENDAATSYGPRPIPDGVLAATPSYVRRSFDDHLPGVSSSGQHRPSEDHAPPSSSFVPRTSASGISPPRAPSSISPTTHASSLPPVLVTRDLPPHQMHALAPNGASTSPTTNSGTTSSAPLVRAPPTGPKVPPTGPRGNWSNPPASPIPAGPRGPAPVGGFALRGGFGHGRGGIGMGYERGFFRGGLRGFRGRGRGS